MSYVRINSARHGRRSMGGAGGGERLRARRARARLIAISAGGIAGMLVFAGAAFASHQPRFQVAEILVEGNGAVPSSAISEIAERTLHDGHFHIFSRSNTLLFPRRMIEEDIAAAFPRIASVHARTRSLSENKIALIVTERTPFARWCEAGSCYFMDEGGLLFAIEDGSTALRDEVFERGMVHGAEEAVGTRFLPGRFSAALETIRLIEREGVNVITMSIENEHDFHLTLGSGVMLYARFRDDPPAIAQQFRLALQSEALAGRLADLVYIDLRFDNRVYYKFK